MKSFNKILFISFSILFLLVSLVYVCNIDNLPNQVILFEGEKLSLNTILGVELETEFSSNPNIERIENNKTVTVSADAQNNKELDCTGTINLSVKLFGNKVKNISVNVIENTEVVPLGSLIGVKLYTNGVLVVGMSEISGTDSNRYKPYEGSGIEEGDVIVEIDNNEVLSTNDLFKKINDSNGNDINIKYIRNRRNINNNNKRY